jgi:[NiFe] hydrogenase large subunit
MSGCKPKKGAGAAAVAGGYDYSGKVVVDPVNRIEGHLRIECEVDNGKVVNAWSSSQLFRGLEIILKGRDPRDAKHFTQRACGVCTHVHALASTRSVDNAVGIQGKIPRTGLLLRNLLMGAQFLHDHVVHFYHLHALDWVDVVNDLSADPKKAAEIANTAGLGHKKHNAEDLKAVQERLTKFVQSGQLGLFSNAYFLEPHAAYKLPPELNLLATAHYLEALKVQIWPARLMAILGGKNPHTQSLLTGGISSYDALGRIKEMRTLYEQTMNFIMNTYLPDVLAVAPYYLDWGGIGGTTHFMTCGEFPEDETDLDSRELPPGVIFNRNIGDVKQFSGDAFAEHVKHSWYNYSSPKHPYNGVTDPNYTGMENMDAEYSWMKSPRYEAKATEVGPLAQVLVAYAKGHPGAQKYVGAVLKHLDVGPEALFSTLGRTAARCIETILVGEKMPQWFDELEKRVASGKDDIVADWEMPDEAQGVGFVHAPRGTLSHWINIKGGKIENYQLVVPSTWNLGPRDDNNVMGPTEEALIGTPVFDPKRPVEILRTVHSYDPCIACGVHVIDSKTNEVYKFKVC